MWKTVYSCIQRITKKKNIRWKLQEKSQRQQDRSKSADLFAHRSRAEPLPSMVLREEGRHWRLLAPRGPCPGLSLSHSPAPPGAKMQVPSIDQHLRSLEECSPSAGVGFGEGVGAPKGHPPLYWTPNQHTACFKWPSAQQRLDSWRLEVHGPRAALHCYTIFVMIDRRTSHNHLYLKESIPSPQELDVGTVLWNSTHFHGSPLDCGLLFTTSERMPSTGPGRTDELGRSSSVSLVPTRTLM